MFRVHERDGETFIFSLQTNKLLCVVRDKVSRKNGHSHVQSEVFRVSATAAAGAKTQNNHHNRHQHGDRYVIHNRNALHCRQQQQQQQNYHHNNNNNYVRYGVNNNCVSSSSSSPNSRYFQPVVANPGFYPVRGSTSQCISRSVPSRVTPSPERIHHGPSFYRPERRRSESPLTWPHSEPSKDVVEEITSSDSFMRRLALKVAERSATSDQTTCRRRSRRTTSATETSTPPAAAATATSSNDTTPSTSSSKSVAAADGNADLTGLSLRDSPPNGANGSGSVRTLNYRSREVLPFSSEMFRKVYPLRSGTKTYVGDNPHHLVTRYEKYCCRAGRIPPQESISFPNVFNKTDGNNKVQHQYSFSARDRRLRRIYLKTGLNGRSRRLKRACKPCSIVLSRLSAEEISSSTQNRRLQQQQQPLSPASIRQSTQRAVLTEIARSNAPSTAQRVLIDSLFNASGDVTKPSTNRKASFKSSAQRQPINGRLLRHTSVGGEDSVRWRDAMSVLS